MTLMDSFVGIMMEHKIDLTSALGLRVVFQPLAGGQQCLLHLSAANQAIALYVSRDQATAVHRKLDVFVGDVGERVEMAIEWNKHGCQPFPAPRKRASFR